MLLLISAIVLCIISYFIMKATEDGYKEPALILNIIFTVLFILMVICVIIFLVGIIGNQIAGITTAQELEVQRNSLVYQYNNQLYLNDINYGANELFNQITEFNKRVRGKQAMAENLWTNWFIPSCWKNVELIPFN